ncbi:MAG: hypothetical protein E3J72_06800 [Planctomycetota bacterium]|nr:MAG: hypothetical protein E3J72_06800 [Planctomycetota bacterium]
MRYSTLLAVIVFLASVSLAAGIAGCSEKKKTPFWIPPDDGPGAGGGPINGTFTFTAIEAETEDPIPGVSVHVDDGNVSDTKTTDADGVATFTGVVGPIELTFWRVPESKFTFFDFNYAELTFPFPTAGPGGNGNIMVDVTITGVNLTSGDIAGFLFAISGNTNFSNTAFDIIGTSTIPSPIPIQLSLGEPTILMAVIGGLVTIFPPEPGITKYGVETYPTGVPPGTTDISLAVSSASGIVPFAFSGTIDKSGLSISPGNGAVTILADLGVDGIFPFGVGSADLVADTYSGSAVRFKQYNRYGMMVVAGSFDNGMSATLAWGTYNTIETITQGPVTLYDVPVMTSPAPGAIGVPVTPTVTWNAAGTGSGANYYFVTIAQLAPPYNWVGLIPAGTATATVPSVASLGAGAPATINVIAVTLDDYNYSTIDPEELLLDSTYLGTSGITPITTAP